jgi:WD40 repeat protein
MAVISLAKFDDNIELLLSGSDDCTIKLWNWVEDNCLKTFIGHECWVEKLVVCS